MPARDPRPLDAGALADDSIEITGIIKQGGPLTKRISLSPEGELLSDGSACVMSAGFAWAEVFRTLAEFGKLIDDLPSHKAIALGALRDDLSEPVQVVTKRRLRERSSTSRYDRIARTRENIDYRPGRPAPALIDIDVKNMPAAVGDRIKKLGGLLRALKSVIPELATAGRVLRRSTSACIRRLDTGEAMASSGGLHIYVLVKDGADIERFLRTLHERCWLLGFGWMTVGAAGQLLERSLIDRMVYAPERLVFEGAPVLATPLVQDQERRRARAIEGPPLDTVAACPPLRAAEKARLKELHAIEAYRLAPEQAKARNQFVDEHASRIAERRGITIELARRTSERWIEGVLSPDFVLPFDDAEFQGCTVADVLRDPERFEAATLADPLEGVAYGRCKAKIMRRADGSVWIHSFAHGRTTYELKFDAAAIEAILKDTPDAELVDVFVNRVPDADIQDHHRERLRNEVNARTGINKRTIDQAIKQAMLEREMSRAQEALNRRLAERRDPRPQVPVPAYDAPWLPQMDALNDILGTSTAAEPPARDIDGYVTQVRTRRPANMHTLTAGEANAEGTEDTRLPPPEQPLLTRLDHAAVAELIEQYINYFDSKGRSVHLPGPFVNHFVRRPDHALPIMNAVATLPIVVPDGTILSSTGLNRDRGIVFRVPPKLLSLMPQVADCTPAAVAEAMDFLFNEWLCDVAADYAGKCILIAIVASIIERTELPERPAFFISAGQRGGGKTTVVNMISVAVLGTRAPASGFSPSEEERRKALLAYLGEGLALIAWDNIPRGASISSPSIEKALTAEMYTDRVLGISENRTVAANAIQVFNGNNISPRGDLASRSLSVRLIVDRPDPENRKFRHQDPIGWTESNRGKILQAIYTVLLGNPRLRVANPPPAETRFKTWFHLVGSAIEHAAQQHAILNTDATPISFRDLFLESEADEEQSDALATVLSTLRTNWPNGFKGADVSHFANNDDEAGEFRAALEEAGGKIHVVSPKTVTWRLKAIADAPIEIDGKILMLKWAPDKSRHGGDFRVEVIAQ